METQVDEIAEGVYRLSTYTDAIAGGFTFNQFLVKGDEALLFHTGPRQIFPLVSAALAKVVPLQRLRWVSFGHWEADESGALNEWLATAPTIRRLAGLTPTTLGIMHGASFAGDGAAVLEALADDYERRFRASIDAVR